MRLTNMNEAMKKYGVLYVDPAWKFDNWSKKGPAVIQSHIMIA